MSTNWSRYATAIQTRDQAGNPKENAVVELPVGKVRHTPLLDVHHAPLPENRAHTNVLGLEQAKNRLERNEIRTQLARLAKWVIHVGI